MQKLFYELKLFKNFLKPLLNFKSMVFQTINTLELSIDPNEFKV